jgi:hypothetical protein
MMAAPLKSNRKAIAVGCVLSLVLVAYIDYITGYELVFSVVYLIPACLCAWYFSKRAVCLISLAGAVASWWADHGHFYRNPIVPYLNILGSLVISLCGGLLLYHFKRALVERAKLHTDLQKAFDDLKQSTEEIKKLQDGLQVVCAWTHKIKVGDRWMSADEFLISQLHLKLSHGMSPEARAQVEKEIEQYNAGQAPKIQA